MISLRVVSDRQIYPAMPDSNAITLDAVIEKAFRTRITTTARNTW